MADEPKPVGGNLDCGGASPLLSGATRRTGRKADTTAHSRSPHAGPRGSGRTTAANRVENIEGDRKNRVGKLLHRWQAGSVDAYERVADVIRYLDERHTDQPNLAALAKRVGLSPFHFHRLFLSWAGVTPKDFLQCLTLAHVKKSLRNGQSVLDAALDVGLSGPGRLHDLCVNLVAASPGEMKSGGARWTIVAGIGASPFGMCLVGKSPRGICHLSFVETGTWEKARAELREEWPKAHLRRDDAEAARMIERIFAPSAGTYSHLPLRAFVRGTAFQVRVWRALLQVPAGKLITYGRLAAAAGFPGAARAVGTAVGRNPLVYLIPCHRVIRETGVIGEYQWGRIRKRALVAWERAQALPPSPVRWDGALV